MNEISQNYRFIKYLVELFTQKQTYKVRKEQTNEVHKVQTN